MTQYKILMADSVLAAVVDGVGVLPPGFRLRNVMSGYQRSGPVTWLVEVEDDDAPPEMEGCLVEPTMQASYDEEGNVASTRIVSRTVLGQVPR
jgi:hypothetical protein